MPALKFTDWEAYTKAFKVLMDAGGWFQGRGEEVIIVSDTHFSALKQAGVDFEVLDSAAKPSTVVDAPYPDDEYEDDEAEEETDTTEVLAHAPKPSLRHAANARVFFKNY